MRAVGLGRLEPKALSLVAGVLSLQRLDLQQRPPGRDVGVGRYQHLAHAAVDRRGQRGLHLHALRYRDHVADLDLVADRHGDRHHHAGARAADQAALVAGNPMRDAVDLDQ